MEKISEIVHEVDLEMRLPDAPTAFPAGSFEKIEVLRQRVEQCRLLFHPDDSQARVLPFRGKRELLFRRDD